MENAKLIVLSRFWKFSTQTLNKHLQYVSNRNVLCWKSTCDVFGRAHAPISGGQGTWNIESITHGLPLNIFCVFWALWIWVTPFNGAARGQLKALLHNWNHYTTMLWWDIILSTPKSLSLCSGLLFRICSFPNANSTHSAGFYLTFRLGVQKYVKIWYWNTTVMVNLVSGSR
jgi:hypothetical protein